MARSEGVFLAPAAGDLAEIMRDERSFSGNDVGGIEATSAISADASTVVEIDDDPTVRRFADAGSDPRIIAATDLTFAAPASLVRGPESTPELPRPAVPRRRFATWSRRYVARLVLADVVVGAVAATVPALVSNTLSASGPLVLALGVLGALVWPAAIATTRGYQRRAVGVGSDELRAVLHAFVAVIVAGAFAAVLLPGAAAEAQHALLKLVVSGTPFAVALSLTTRYVTRKRLHIAQGSGVNVRHVVVAGSPTAARELGQRLAGDTQCGMKVIGVCVPSQDISAAVDMGMPVLGDLSQVAQVIEDFGCDSVAVTSDDTTRYNYLRELSWSLEGSGVEMLVDPGLVEVAGPRMHIRALVGFPLLHIEEPHFTGWRRLVKRTSDIVLTSVGLVLISPLLAAIAVAIRLQDGGPIIFAQSRIGRGGEPFRMFKFRSMVVNAEERLEALLARNEGKGGLFKLGDDPRITRLGKFLRDFSLDELPQLINVLNGSMSLVGPRPHLAAELAAMPGEASRRALVTPGLTGLWQVSGRSDLEGDEAIRLDLRYVENWSLTYDLLILWRTMSAVLAKRGAR